MSGRVRGRGRVATGTVCEIDFETGEVSRYVQDVTISGFRVRDFIGSGLTAVGARDTTFSGNAVRNNADAGIWSGSSIGTRMLSNRASGSRFGLRVVGSLGGAIVANSLHHNCVGMVAINSTGPVGQFDMIANDVAHNTRACPPDDEFGALSGVGVGLVGATGARIVGNRITGNVPGGNTDFSGGVIAVAGAAGNVVQGNIITRNNPDIFWDEVGAGNAFRHNLCGTSTPPGLCH